MEKNMKVVNGKSKIIKERWMDGKGD